MAALLLTAGVILGSACPWGACAFKLGHVGEDDDDASREEERTFWPFPVSEDDDEEEDGFESLNHALMKLTPEVATRRFGAVAPRLPTPPHALPPAREPRSAAASSAR